MSRNTSGNYQLPSGNPVLGGTTITTNWANSTLGDLASEMTDSLCRSGKGAMLAPLKMADGSAAAPALTWTADPDSGLYRAGDGDVRMQVDAAQTMQWTSTGVTIPTALTASGGATLSGTNTISGVTTVSGATTFTTQAPVSNVGAAGLVLKPSSLDHVYAEFYADTGAPNTRSGVLGYGSAGTTELLLQNEMTSGDTRITATSGSVVIGTQQLKMNGSAPSSSTAISNAVTKTNIAKAWATLTTTGGGSTSVAVTDGFNVSSAACDTTTIGITFASAFANTNYAVFASCRNKNMVLAPAALPSTTQTGLTGVDVSPGTTSPLSGYNFRDDLSVVVHIVVFGAQ